MSVVVKGWFGLVYRGAGSYDGRLGRAFKWFVSAIVVLEDAKGKRES